MTVQTANLAQTAASKARRFQWLHRPEAPLWLLLIITVFAAVIRFQRLDHPPLLIDECFTFWRTCGTYGQLVETLRDDGFVPLHYELLWWIHRGMPLGPGIRLIAGGLDLTPTVMRFIPAVCGTLMVPTIYFVARQLFTRRAALLAALFVACSAYAQFFSRDSKMYMPAWFLGTLGIGCLLWWLRTGRSTAWLAWIAAAGAAGGVHVVTLLLLGLAPLFLLTQRRTNWRQCLLLLLGIIIIVSGPAGYYGVFNQWTQKSGGLVPGVANEPPPDANWDASGLNWLGQNDSDAATAFQSLSTYLTAYEWDGSIESDRFGVTPTWIRRSIVTSVSGMLCLFVIGMLPWPKRLRVNNSVDDAAPESWWRAALWLGAWIALPAYGFFYCRSFDAPVSPVDFLISAGQWWGSAWPWLTALTIITTAAAIRWRRFAAVLGIIIYALSFAVFISALLGATEVVSQALEHDPVRWLALIIFPATILAYAGNTIRQRAIKFGQLALVTSIILIICLVAHVAWAQVRAAALAKHPELQWHTIWHTRYVAIVWPAIWIAAAALILRLPTRPLRLLAIIAIVAVNLTNGIARSIAQTQVPYDRAFDDVWLSQPGSATRTYFDLNRGVQNFFGSGGIPSGAYWRPIASYNAWLASRIPTNPEDFRIGKTWPFIYGPMMDRFMNAVVYRPFVDAGEIAADVSKSPQIKRVIIWEMTNDSAPATDGLATQLGPRWRLVHEEVITQWWYWTWGYRGLFRHRELIRTGM